MVVSSSGLLGLFGNKAEMGFEAARLILVLGRMVKALVNRRSWSEISVMVLSKVEPWQERRIKTEWPLGIGVVVIVGGSRSK